MSSIPPTCVLSGAGITAGTLGRQWDAVPSAASPLDSEGFLQLHPHRVGGGHGTVSPATMGYN
jgi:hypothetical protein